MTGLRREWRLAAFCVGVAAIAMFYNLFRSPDVLYDEAAYTWAAQQVATGWHLTLDNQPLFVHPPLPFLAQAGWLRLTGYATAPLASAIHAARLLAASAGTADVLLIGGLGYRLASAATPRRRRVLTGAITVLAALDPVLVRYDRQNVIEPFALLASLLLLHAAWTLRDRGALAYVSVTGLLGGLALLTNEITVFLVVIPPLYAVLERSRTLIRRTLAALAISVAIALIFFAWALELGQGASFIHQQTISLQRLAGLVQITGLNIPGVSLSAALERSVTTYSSTYIVLLAGLGALVWCWSRRNTQAGNFLTAWLTASYAAGAYIVAVGTLNEQFFVYLLPGVIVGVVLFADALVTARGSWLARVIVALGCAATIGLSGFSWLTNYTSPGDGVTLADQYIASRLPACAAVNASGDPQKYELLLGGRFFTYFAVGPAALADGVHYFLLSPTDAVEHTGDMSPQLADWIRANGREIAVFPSQVYKTVQLWYVSASPYNQLADAVDIAGGLYVNTVGSHCGGYDVTGAFYAAYQSLGGKAVLGAPRSRVFSTADGTAEQVFDGGLLVDSGRRVHEVPVTAAALSRVPAAAKSPQQPPALPDDFPLGPAEPTSALPFVITLGATLLGYGLTVFVIAWLRRRRRPGARPVPAGLGAGPEHVLADASVPTERGRR